MQKLTRTRRFFLAIAIRSVKLWSVVKMWASSPSLPLLHPTPPTNLDPRHHQMACWCWRWTAPTWKPVTRPWNTCFPTDFSTPTICLSWMDCFLAEIKISQTCKSSNPICKISFAFLRCLSCRISPNLAYRHSSKAHASITSKRNDTKTNNVLLLFPGMGGLFFSPCNTFWTCSNFSLLSILCHCQSPWS